MERRLIKHGPSSAILTLPVQWMRDQKLAAGDTVIVTPDGDKLIVTGNKPQALTETTLEITGLDRTSIALFIRAAYRAGYAKITVRYSDAQVHHYRKGIDVPVTVAVRDELNRLMGVEITEQKEGFLVIQEITKSSAHELLNMYRKAFTMTHQLIVQITGTRDDEDIGVEDRHDVITKVISYAIRILTVGEANLSSKEKARMLHGLMLLDIIADILKQYHRDFTKHTQSFLDELTLAFTEVEKVVFAQDRAAMKRFQEIKQRSREQPVDRLLPVIDVLFDMVLLYAAD